MSAYSGWWTIQWDETRIGEEPYGDLSVCVYTTHLYIEESKAKIDKVIMRKLIKDQWKTDYPNQPFPITAKSYRVDRRKITVNKCDFTNNVV